MTCLISESDTAFNNEVSGAARPWEGSAPTFIGVLMRRIAVIGPNPPGGALSNERFVELLSSRLGLEAFSLRPVPGLVLATSGAAQLPLVARPANVYATATAYVEADTLIWLRFAPSAYFRDWLAGWLDTLLNGAAGSRRRAYRSRLIDVVRACFAMLQRDAVDECHLNDLRPHFLFLEFSSPEQALFWLEMNEERVRETEPPRL